MGNKDVLFTKEELLDSLFIFIMNVLGVVSGWYFYMGMEKLFGEHTYMLFTIIIGFYLFYIPVLRLCRYKGWFIYY